MIFRRTPHVGRKPPTNPLRIGAVVLIALAVITYGGFHKRVPFLPQWTLKGNFVNSGQVRPGAPVRIAGVDVGKVIGLSRGPGSTAIVTMTIKNSGRPIHSDARLTIRPRLFLEGGYFVQIEPGSASAPTVSSGHVIPVGQTAAPVSFFNVISTLNSPTREELISSLHQLAIGLTGGGAESFNELITQLPSTLKDGAITARALQGQQPDDVSRTIAGAARVSRALAAHDAALGGLLSGLNRVAGTLASRDTALAASVRELDGTLIAAPPALSALDRSLPELTRFSNAIRPGLRLAPPVLNRAAALLDQIDAISRPGQLPTVIGLLHPIAKALPTLYGRLETLFPRLAPVVSCVNGQVVPALNAKLDDGALTTNQPVWQELAHSMAGLAADAANFDSNGAYSRFSGGIGTSILSFVPGLGQVLQTQGITGTRPQWGGPDAAPPFRPDAPCTAQPPESLQTPAVLASADRRPVPSSARATGTRAQLLRQLLHPRIANGKPAVKVVP